MIECKFCHSMDVRVISSNGNELVIHCTNCDEMFEITKDELENDEYNADQIDQFLVS